MSTLLSRWEGRLADRVRRERAARARYIDNPTPINRAALAAARASTAQARKVVDRHSRVTGVSAAGVNFIKRFEGFSPVVYDDGVGVKTIGYGTTAADVKPLPKHVTEPQAAALLREKLNRKYAPPVMHALAPMMPTQNQIDAAVSFAYNLGEGAFEGAPGFETLTRAIRSRKPRAIAEAFLLYDNPNDPAVHAGLRRRRLAEHDLFLKG